MEVLPLGDYKCFHLQPHEIRLAQGTREPTASTAHWTDLLLLLPCHALLFPTRNSSTMSFPNHAYKMVQNRISWSQFLPKPGGF